MEEEKRVALLREQCEKESQVRLSDALQRQLEQKAVSFIQIICPVEHSRYSIICHRLIYPSSTHVHCLSVGGVA